MANYHASFEGFPHVEHYLARFGGDLGAHPDCETKASVFRDTLTARGAPDLHPGVLPEAIADLIWDPPPPSVLVPTVQAMAVLIALRDVRAETDADFIQLNYEAAVQLYARPMYKMLMHTVSVERLLRTLSRRWSTFHHGTTLTLGKAEAGHVEVHLEFPDKLYSPLLLRGFEGSLRAAAEAAGAKDVRGLARGISDTGCTYEYRYTP